MSVKLTDPNIIKDIIRNGRYATLALSRMNEPYIITLNYGYDSETQCMYFHTAKRGLKLEFLKENPNVCGTIIEDKGYKQGLCTHAYRSVVFTGQIEILEDQDRIIAGIEVMLNHLENDPEIMRKRLHDRKETYNGIYILRLIVSDITGKEGQ